MAIAFVRKTDATALTGGSTTTVTLSGASVAGNKLVALIGTNGFPTGIHVTSVTDSAGNTWSQCEGVTDASDVVRAEAWETTGTPASASTVTVHWSASANETAVRINEFSGASTSAFDVGVTHTVHATSIDSGNTSATTDAHDCVVGMIWVANNVTISGQTSGYTDQGNATISSLKLDSGYQVLSATGVQHYGASFSGTAYAAAICVAFKPAPATVPDAPTIGTATAGNTQATVTWTAPGNDGGAAITNYVVTPYIGATAQATTTFGNVLSGTVTGLTNGTAYTFKVAATNSVGTGAQSAASNAVTPATVPGAPTGATASAGDMQATVSWAAPSDNGGSAITGYVVTPYIGAVAQTPTTLGVVLTTTVTGLTNGTSYTFTIEALNAVGASAESAHSNSVTPTRPTPAGVVLDTARIIGSGAGSVDFGATLSQPVDWSALVAVFPSAGLGIPSAPLGVVGSPGEARANLSWGRPLSDGGSPITGYTITPYIGAVAQPPTTVGPVLFVTIGGLVDGTTYTFTVFATNSQGDGPAAAASNSVTPGTSSLPIQTSPLRGFAWNHGRTTAKNTLGRLKNVPVVKSTLNGGFQQIAVEVATAADGQTVDAGDYVEVTEEATGTIVFSGLVNDDPKVYDEDSSYSFVLDSLVTELAANPFIHKYATATDVATMVQDVLAQVQAGGGHLTSNATSCPGSTGITGVFDFDSTYNCLTALEEIILIAGFGWYFFVDEIGLLWFQKVDYTKAPTHLLSMTTDYTVSRRQGPIDNLCNFVQCYGAPDQTTGIAIVATSQDATSIASYGRRALTPALSYPNVSDLATLQRMSDALLAVLSKRVFTYEVTMPYFAHSPGKRVSIGVPTGATTQLYEPATLPDQVQFSGVGGQVAGQYGPLVVQDVEVDGVTQKLTVGDIPYTQDDLQYLIDSMANRASTAVINNNGGGGGGGGGGIPAGGAIGQVLTKYSTADFAADWESVAGGGGCGGEVLMDEETTQLAPPYYAVVTGGTVVEVPLTVDTPNTRVRVTVKGSVIAPTPASDIPVFQVGINAGFVNRGDFVSADATWRNFSLEAPEIAVVPQGDYTVYLHITNESDGAPWSGGTLHVAYQMLIYLVTSG